MSAEFAYDVFLSHGAKDKAAVRPLAERLHARAEVRRKKWNLGLRHSSFSLCYVRPGRTGRNWKRTRVGGATAGSGDSPFATS